MKRMKKLFSFIMYYKYNNIILSIYNSIGICACVFSFVLCFLGGGHRPRRHTTDTTKKIKFMIIKCANVHHHKKINHTTF